MSASQNRKKSNASSVPPDDKDLLSPEDTLERRIEAVKTREAKTAKKEKDLFGKQQDIDRRLKLLEDAEEKHGNMQTREQAAEAREKDNEKMMKDIKRKEKAMKDSEAALTERETNIYSKETSLAKLEKELNIKMEAVDDRERKAIADANATEEKRKQLNTRQLEMDTRDANLKKKEEKMRQSEEDVQLKWDEFNRREADLRAKEKNLRTLEEQHDRRVHQANQKQSQLNQQEMEQSRAKQKILEKEERLKAEDERIMSENKTLMAKTEELGRRQQSVEASEAELRQKTAEFNHLANDVTRRKDICDKQTTENRKLEVELNELRLDLRAQETDVRNRERRIASMMKEHQEREQTLSEEERRMSERQGQWHEKERQQEIASQELQEKDAQVSKREREAKATQDRYNAKEQQLQQRSAMLDTKERELVDWMKEMEWREMMLGDRESIVDRQPVTLQTAHGGSSGYCQKSFGHAMVEVQLRRLKDQYISAQMKHAREELSTGKTLYSGKKNTRRTPRHGVTPTYSSGDVSHEVDQVSQLWDLRAQAHRLSLDFVHMMSKLRAFDGFESPTSPEKLEHLSAFSDTEKTVLCMAANMEYLLKDHEAFYSSLGQSPLDDKDKAQDVQDLMNKVSVWWKQKTETCYRLFMQLLKDRETYLQHSIQILHAKSGSIGVLSPQVGPRSYDGLSPKGTAAATEGAPNYTADSAYGHVKESKILAPRGMATLNAVGEQQPGSGNSRPGTSPGASMNTCNNQLTFQDDHHGSRRNSPDSRRPMSQNTNRSSLPPVSPYKDGSGDDYYKRSEAATTIDFGSMRSDHEGCLMHTGRAPSAGLNSQRPFDLSMVRPRKAVSPYAAVGGGIKTEEKKKRRASTNTVPVERKEN